MRPGSFIIGGVNSESFGTLIQDRPLLEAPSRKVEWKSSHGTDGDIPFDEGAYNNTSMKLILVTSKGYTQGDVYNAIDTRGKYVEFIPYFDPEKIYRVMLNDKTEFESKFYYGGNFATATHLTIKPYKHLVGDHDKIFTTKSFNLTNPTKYVAQPIIKIRGEGDVDLKVNGIEFKIRGMSGEIVLDSLRYLAYAEGSTGSVLGNRNDKIYSRDYPLLIPGVNRFEITGNVTRTIVEPGWRVLV